MLKLAIAIICSTACAGFVDVDLVTSRGMLDGQMVPVFTNSVVEGADTMCYRLDIKAAAIDLISEAVAGTNSLPSIACVTTTGAQAVLVAPNVALGCAHYTYSAGQVITFGSGSATVERVIFDPSYVGPGGVGDYTYIILDRSLPITPAILALRSWPDDLGLTGVLSVNETVPCFVVARAGVTYKTSLKGRTSVRTIPLGVGDSGSPVMLSIRGRWVVLGPVISMAGQFSVPIEGIDGVKRGFFHD